MAELTRITANRKPYEWLRQSRKRFNYMMGGASSSKSWTIAQYLLIEKLYKEPGIGIMCLRASRPAVKASCYRLCKSWLSKLGWPYQENKSDLVITAPNGSKMYFEGLDDPEKKKSVEGINYIWVEETTEINKMAWMQLNIRCRATNPYGINQLFFSFNPVDPVGNEWLKMLTDYPDDKSQVMRLTHMDNPFLADEEREQIENLANMDPEYDMIYRQGLWATPTFIIYRNWDIVQAFNPYCDNVGYGLDFGYNNATALLKVGFRDKVDVYIDELIYESKLTNTDLIERMKILIPDRDSMIVADCAEPDRIEEISNAGFNIFPCIKGPGSVGVGIDRCKRHRLHITEQSQNTITEIKGYKWKVDKNGNILDEPVEFRDHSMSALRYYLGSTDFEEVELYEVGQLLS